MAAVGIDQSFSQREDEIVPYTFDYSRACRDSTGALYDSISSAHVDETTGLTVSPPAHGATTVQVLVSGGTVGSTYTVRMLATMVSGQERDLAAAITVTQKAGL